jgi:hypothetical protein
MKKTQPTLVFWLGTDTESMTLDQLRKEHASIHAVLNDATLAPEINRLDLIERHEVNVGALSRYGWGHVSELDYQVKWNILKTELEKFDAWIDSYKGCDLEELETLVRNMYNDDAVLMPDKDQRKEMLRKKEEEHKHEVAAGKLSSIPTEDIVAELLRRRKDVQFYDENFREDCECYLGDYDKYLQGPCTLLVVNKIGYGRDKRGIKR